MKWARGKNESAVRLRALSEWAGEIYLWGLRSPCAAVIFSQLLFQYVLGIKEWPTLFLCAQHGLMLTLTTYGHRKARSEVSFWNSHFLPSALTFKHTSPNQTISHLHTNPTPPWPQHHPVWQAAIGQNEAIGSSYSAWIKDSVAGHDAHRRTAC